MPRASYVVDKRVETRTKWPFLPGTSIHAVTRQRYASFHTGKGIPCNPTATRFAPFPLLPHESWGATWHGREMKSLAYYVCIHYCTDMRLDTPMDMIDKCLRPAGCPTKAALSHYRMVARTISLSLVQTGTPWVRRLLTAALLPRSLCRPVIRLGI